MVINSSNNIHLTWGPPFSRALYLVGHNWATRLRSCTRLTFQGRHNYWYRLAPHIDIPEHLGVVSYLSPTKGSRMCPQMSFRHETIIAGVTCKFHESPYCIALHWNENYSSCIQSPKKWLAPASVLLWLQTIFSAPVLLQLLPGLACSIHATWGPPLSRAL